MLPPGGAERCMMTLHFPFFLGTTPNPKQQRLGSGLFVKGPRCGLLLFLVPAPHPPPLGGGKLTSNLGISTGLV